MRDSRRNWLRIAAAALVAAAGLAQLGAKPASKVSVLGRVRVGGFAEDLTYVRTGALAHHIVFAEGYEIWGTPSRAAVTWRGGHHQSLPKARKLFDLYALNPVPRPTGIAYVESRKLFVVNGAGPGNLYFVDDRGRPKGSASMAFPLIDGYTPNYIEGIAYIPSTAGQFPDHLVMAAQNSDGSADLLVVDLTGQVAKHFVPHCYDSSGDAVTDVASVEYLPGDRLVLADFGHQALCVVDFDGVSSAPAIFVDTVGRIGEGVTRLADGRIVVVGWPQNLLFFDANLNRLPQFDRHDVVGLGLNQPRGLAWDSSTRRHLFSYFETVGGQPSAIAAVPPSLATSTKVTDLTSWSGYSLPTGAMTHLGAERRVALAQAGQSSVVAPPLRPALPWFRGLLLSDAAGALVEQIDLCVPSAPTPPSTCTKDYGSLQPTIRWGRASGVAYVPGATPADGRFAVRFTVGVASPDPGVADAWTVYFFTRAGDPDGKIDLGLTAGLTSVNALEYFDPGDGTGGRFILIGRTASSPNQQVLITDLDGNKLDSFDALAELGLPTPSEVSAITTGHYKGTFAALDGAAQEMVVFRMK